MTLTSKTILQELTDKEIRRNKIGGFDIDGILRGKFVSRDKFASALEGGLGFCDVIFGWDCGDVLYDNVQVTGWHTGYPDVHAKIEPDTMRIVPWEENTALFLLDFYDAQGGPLGVSPQQVLKRVIGRARELGYDPIMSAEFEFFIFDETPESVRQKRYHDMTNLTPGMFGYSVLRASMLSDLVGQLIEDMDAYDCPIEGIHTETGPGVYECALAYNGALKAAQQAALFKTGVKEICARHGLMATFMAKWNAELPGCSGHIHQSLWDLNHSHNLFHSDDGAHRGMSDLMRHYVAGVVQTMPEFTALYAPTINSYKRMVEGTWAPTAAAWGFENRTAALRVIPGSAKSTRCELRASGADMNPFLSFAATLAAGLHGIENRLELGPPCAANAYDPAAGYPPLPPTLGAAADALDKSEVARKYLGDDFVNHYVATRRWEVRQFQRAVTQWELDRYFEVI
jgi:glutamine synthetase